jgi:AraC-like DNA-binding protein
MYRSDIDIDGFSYQVSVQLPTEEVPSSGTVLHNHSRYELHALINGSARLEFEDRPSILVNSGDCWIIPPQIYHLRRIHSGSASYFVMYIRCSTGAPLQLKDVYRLQCAPELIHLLQSLANEYKSRKLGADNAIQSLCSLLVVTLLRELAAPKKQHILPSKVLSQQRDDLMDNYFAVYYAHEISATDLAQKLNITTRHLARIMQQRYGCTFRQHLLEIRLYHARQQLVNTKAPIWQIANDCGFTCQGAFATAFRKQSGCTPSQFRQQNDLKN